eukprot:TRINITY_DN1354_c0_g1_i3.p1 TRINITY_DN1354_c0_g1~~TRINITY_DN1354_c0_g1_i3.p1  ORF type:complete len:892 (-),score=113.63 TRINITY_DN1354_c0_g1_i3:285-2936(-)
MILFLFLLRLLAQVGQAQLISQRAIEEHLQNYGITDHPQHAAAESLQYSREPVGQLMPTVHKTVLEDKLSVLSPMFNVVEEGFAERYWILSKAGVPCYFPFSFGGRVYTECHPDGWCCLDPACAKRSTCKKSTEQRQELPLTYPRDNPATQCILKGTTWRDRFSWNPRRKQDVSQTTIFLLHDWDASSEPLWSKNWIVPVKLAMDFKVQFVILSYASAETEVKQLMSKLRSRVSKAIANLTAASQETEKGMRRHGRQDTILKSFHFVKEPAWHISMNRCWLPSVIHSWSAMRGVLTAFHDSDSVSDGAAFLRSVGQGTRGGWAPSIEDRSVTGKVVWFGLACGENETLPETLPQPAGNLNGSVALVARGRCSFYSKVKSARDAGAIGIIVFNMDETPAFSMGCAAPDPCKEVLNISAVMVDGEAGYSLMSALFGSNWTNRSTAVRPGLVAHLGSEWSGPSIIGLLAHGGGIWAPGSKMMGWHGLEREILGMEYQKKLAVQRASYEAAAGSGDHNRRRTNLLQGRRRRRGHELHSGNVAKFEVFKKQPLEGVWPSTLVGEWPAENSRLIVENGYDSLEIEFHLDCENHMDSKCAPWDMEMNLFFCTEGRSDHPTNCRDSASLVARWITPYGREGRWLSNATAALPLLLAAAGDGSKPASLHLTSSQVHLASMVFWLRRSSSEGRPRGIPLARVQLWDGGFYGKDYNDAHPALRLEAPRHTSRAVLSVLLTGHGWGLDEENCAEFCAHSHHFQVNGHEELVKAHPKASSRDGCFQKVLDGAVPNQHGTWPFGRAGWCPGMHVNWWEKDITSMLHNSTLNNITYRSLFNGSDYVAAPSETPNKNGYPAQIHMVSFVTFYGEEEHSDSYSKGIDFIKAERTEPTLLL